MKARHSLIGPCVTCVHNSLWSKPRGSAETSSSSSSSSSREREREREMRSIWSKLRRSDARVGDTLPRGIGLSRRRAGAICVSFRPKELRVSSLSDDLGTVVPTRSTQVTRGFPAHSQYVMKPRHQSTPTLKHQRRIPNRTRVLPRWRRPRPARATCLIMSNALNLTLAFLDARRFTRYSSIDLHA